MSVSEIQPPANLDIRPGVPLLRSASLWQRLALAARILRVRLRFVFVLVVAFVVVGKWHALQNYWDKITRPAASLDTTGNAVSLDTEYFCPMDPGVVSDWSGKCGICNMTLVRRKRGDVVQLPDGVVARMQLSPYRVQLAGIQTSPASFRPLVREVVTIGWVQAREVTSGEADPHRAVIEAEVFERDMPFVAEGQTVEVTCDAIPGHHPFVGKVGPTTGPLSADSHTIRVPVVVDDPRHELRAEMWTSLRIKVPVVEIEPFRSMPRTAPPAKPDQLREVFVCSEHPDVLKDKPGKCPLGKNELERRALAENQRLDWWCPMHPKVTANATGAKCAECDGMRLIPRVVSYSPVGEVLAVPESAVIDTGMRKVVYIERTPGMFDGVEVTLGPRCGDFYPVIKGLDAGQRVATAGAFLIDAESRLNPSLSVSYFGAGSSGGQNKKQ